MARQLGSESVYEGFQRFVTEALRTDSSIFTPGARIWTLENLTALHRHFNEQPDEGSDRFEKKLAGQLKGASAEVVQLMAEVVHVAQSIVDDTTLESKQKSIQQVLDISPTPLAIDPAQHVGWGLVGGGLSFKTLKPFQLWYLIDFAKAWKQLSEDRRTQLLDDPWEFKEFAWTVPIDKGYAMREAILHMVFPDTFEDIVAKDHKAQIARTFAHLVDGLTDDVDRQLLAIRAEISKEADPGWTFYDEVRQPIWDPEPIDSQRWDAFAEWARLFLDSKDLHAEERQYKLRLAEGVGEVRDAVLQGREWLPKLSSVMKSSEFNLVPWQATSSFLDGCQAEPERAEAAFRALWKEGASWLPRARSFSRLAPPGTERAPVPIMSFLLMAEDASRFPIFRPRAYSLGQQLVGMKPVRNVFRWQVIYRKALRFIDTLMDQMRERGIELQDRLDAQGLLWMVVKYEPDPAWPEAQREALVRWRDSKGERVEAPKRVADPPADYQSRRPGSLASLAEDLYMPEEFLTDTIALLRERKQVVFYGPPGTGKTYVARKLAAHLAPDDGCREVVQFHPSYSYEDFVHGYRPAGGRDGISYELTAGPLKRLADRAAAAPDVDHFLIIDEINRGNLPKILGELLYLLEYRGDSATLMYGDERFSIPSNLLIVGTMNTADRSIGLIDAALRRRFHFVPFFPGEGPLRTVLRDWLSDNKPEMTHVASIVDQLNEVLRGRFNKHLQLGHSYFLRSDLSEEVLSRIWEYDVLPFLEDNLFGQDEELKAFELARLRGAISDEDDQPEGTLADDDDSDD